MTSEKGVYACHYQDLGSASDWSCRVGNLIQPIRSTTQIWVVMRHQYGISALVSQTSFGWETSGGVVKCPLFSQAIFFLFWFTLLYWIRHKDSTRRQGMKRDLRPNWYQPFITHPTNERFYHTKGVYAPLSLRTAVLVLLRPTIIITEKELWDGAYDFSFLSEKTGMSNN